MKAIIQFIAKISLCFAILASIQSADAVNFGNISRAARIAFVAAKKIAKLSAVVYGAYWATGSILNHCNIRSDTTTYPATERLVVYTDGKVSIRRSQDRTIKVTHEYGASRRSDLPQITFNETFDQGTNTLTVQGLLEECHTSKFQQFIQRLFRLQPQRTLHHIIEVPETTQIEVTTGNTDRYTHHRQLPVQIDSIAGNITVHTASGDVLVENTNEQAKLTAIHRHKPSDIPQVQAAAAYRTQHHRGESLYQVEWDKKIHNKRLAQIYTPDRAIARNLIGTLEVFGARELQAERHIQNLHGKISLDGVEQPYRRPPVQRRTIKTDDRGSEIQEIV